MHDAITVRGLCPSKRETERICCAASNQGCEYPELLWRGRGGAGPAGTCRGATSGLGARGASIATNGAASCVGSDAGSNSGPVRSDTTCLDAARIPQRACSPWSSDWLPRCRQCGQALASEREPRSSRSRDRWVRRTWSSPVSNTDRFPTSGPRSRFGLYRLPMAPPPRTPPTPSWPRTRSRKSCSAPSAGRPGRSHGMRCRVPSSSAKRLDVQF